jgi:hypothetical protein
MKYYKFKDDKGQEGIVTQFLNEIGQDKIESVDLVVKFFCKNNNCVLHRFKNFDEVKLTEITKTEYENLRKS